MSEFGRLYGASRSATWYERAREARLREEGIADVLLPPEEAPTAFWDSVLAASEYYLPIHYGEDVNRWLQELRFMIGARPAGLPEDVYNSLVGGGTITGQRVSTELRFSAVELMMDIADDPSGEFEARVNDRARYHRVGVQIENRRFVPLQSEFLHSEVVQPTLILLSEERFRAVDELFRKAYARALTSDASGAVTNATGAVEEMFRALGAKGATLDPLVRSAREAGWIGAAEATVLPKLMALRDDSDAHGTGTSEFDRAMLAINLAAAVLVHLGRTEVQ